MHENYISRMAAVACLFWIIAGVDVAIVWLLAILDAPLRYEGAVGVLAVAMMVAGGMCQMRLYTMRVIALVRAMSGPDGTRGELHSLTR